MAIYLQSKRSNRRRLTLSFEEWRFLLPTLQAFMADGFGHFGRHGVVKTPIPYRSTSHPSRCSRHASYGLDAIAQRLARALSRS